MWNEFRLFVRRFIKNTSHHGAIARPMATSLDVDHLKGQLAYAQEFFNPSISAKLLNTRLLMSSAVSRNFKTEAMLSANSHVWVKSANTMAIS